MLERYGNAAAILADVAANELAVEAVNHESDTLDREIRNLKTELELRRELANNSPMAIIQRHGARAAGAARPWVAPRLSLSLAALPR